jgi:hypothetical protein
MDYLWRITNVRCVASPIVAHQQKLAASPTPAGVKQKHFHLNYWHRLILCSAIKVAFANSASLVFQKSKIFPL